MNNKLIMSVVGIAICVILVGSVLAPVIDDAQINAGNPVTFNNDIKTDTLRYTIWDGSNITLKYDNTTGTYTVNDVAQNWAGNTQRIVIASNDFAARNGGTSASAQLQTQYVSIDTQVINKSFTFTVVNHEYTLVLERDVPVTYTGTLDWLVYAMDDGATNLGQLTQPATSSFYTSLKDDVIVLGNIYTTGNNATFYSYYNGELTVNEQYLEDSNVNIVRTEVDGYTDIFATSITVNVGDESFLPYYILAPIDVSGHEAKGGTYSLYGAIPLIVIAALIVSAVALVRPKD